MLSFSKQKGGTVKYKYPVRLHNDKWRLIFIVEQTEQEKDGPYKHPDEDAYLKDHPDELFEPFDPSRELPYKPKKQKSMKRD